MEGFDPDAAKTEMLNQIGEFDKLSKLADNDDVKALFDYQIKVAAQKMVHLFTSKDVKSWDDFCLLRGEIIARLEPVQTVYTAEAASKQLQAQLREMFTTEQ